MSKMDAMKKSWFNFAQSDKKYVHIENAFNSDGKSFGKITVYFMLAKVKRNTLLESVKWFGKNTYFLCGYFKLIPVENISSCEIASA